MIQGVIIDRVSHIARQRVKVNHVRVCMIAYKLCMACQDLSSEIGYIIGYKNIIGWSEGIASGGRGAESPFPTVNQSSNELSLSSTILSSIYPPFSTRAEG